MSFDEEEFIRFALENNVVVFRETLVKLSSGRLSHLYINWENVTYDVFLTKKLINFIFQFTKDRGLNPSTFYGVPEGATKLGILTQYEWATQSGEYGRKNYVLAMGRGGEPKEHGMEKDRVFLGKPIRDTIILEDAVSRGKSLSDVIEKVQNPETSVIAAISLTDRSGMRKFGVPYHTLSNVRDLFREGCKKLNPSRKIIQSIEKEFEDLGY